MVRAMKTTLDIDDDLLKKAKVLAARERKSLTGLVEEALRLRLRRRRLALPVYRGRSGLAKGIDPLSLR